MEKIRVFAPNTVANVGCGYDVLGFALEEYGDEIILHKRPDDHLVITSIEGANLPTDPESNVATVAMRALLADAGYTRGFDVSIKKNFAPGSGLGSSASSSAAAVFALNEMLHKPYTRDELVRFAMEGERSSSGNAHADNVAPALLGGFTVVRSYQPLDVFNIPYPQALRAVVIYPHVETKTADAKRILKKQIPLADAVKQWGNVAGLISGLMQVNYARIGASLEDVIIEPVRSALIPFFDDLRVRAMEAGALGFGISGSGPSTFALTEDENKAEAIRQACAQVYESQDIAVTSFVSKINNQGAVVL